MINGRFLITVASCLLALHAAPVSAQTAPAPLSILEGIVVGVTEGDRLTVNCLGEETHLRLYGVATPQTVKLDKFTGWYKTGQPYGDDAFRALTLKVLHQNVRVEVWKTVTYKGQENPVAVATVYVDGRNVNLEMVQEGWGWVYRSYLLKHDLPVYLGAEKQARLRRRGLWADDNPVPPWHFQPKLRIRTTKVY